MRSFLYGRYDVLRGARGYEVFASDRQINSELIRQLTPCFSTEDPHFSMLQTLGEFYVYFPAGQGEWVFGVGNVEERGDYFYYMLHGVVLNEGERQKLGYNPFRLAPYLNPLVGDARVLPELPADMLNRASQAKGLGQSLKSLASDQDGMTAYAVGILLDQLLRLNSQKQGGRLVYGYHPNLDASVWHLLFELLPTSWRAQVSISSLDVFLKLPTLIQGSFQAANPKDSHLVYLDLSKPEPTPVGYFLQELVSLSDSAKEQRLEMLEALQKDAFEQGASAAAYANYLAAITKALVRPSLRTMQRWQAIEAGRHLFAWKAHYLIQIWDRLGEETAYFPKLATTMVSSMQEDYQRLQPSVSGEEDARLRSHLNRLILHVEGLNNRELILLVLGSPSLAADFFPKVDDQKLVNAMWRETLDGSMFESLLRNRLRFKPSWSEALDGLWSHPQMPRCSPALLAQIFDLLIQWKTRFAIQQLVEHGFSQDPQTFSEFLGHLKQRTQMISRFVHMLGRMLVWTPEEKAQPLCHLLQICLEQGPKQFKAIAGGWIQQRAVEFMLPKLASDPVLAPELLALWQNQADDDLKHMRVLHFVRLMYPRKHPREWPHPEVVSVLQSNALFECLLEPDVFSSRR